MLGLDDVTWRTFREEIVKGRLPWRIVRVYASHGYFEPKPCTPAPDSPWNFTDKPLSGLRMTAQLGDADRDALVARHASVSLSRKWLKGLFRSSLDGAPITPGELHSQARSEASRTIDNHRWFTTFSIRPSDDLWTGALMTQALAAAETTFDWAAGVVSLELGGQFVENLLFQGVLFERPDDGLWFQIPTFRFNGRLKVSRVGSAAELQHGAERIKDGLSKIQGERGVPDAVTWFLRAQTTSDPHDAFVWLFFALEVAVNGIYQRHLSSETYARAVGAVADALAKAGWPADETDKWRARPWSKRKGHNLAMRFGLVGAHLGCNWDAHATVFRQLKDLRNDIMHGSVDARAGDAETRQLREVLEVFLRAALPLYLTHTRVS